MRESNQSQFATGSQKHREKSATPYAFTEHGVTMLASVLRSGNAVKMSVAIVRAFIALKEFMLQQKEVSVQLEQLRQELSGRIGEHDVQLSAIYDAIENLLDKQAIQQSREERNRIGFNGQIRICTSFRTELEIRRAIGTTIQQVSPCVRNDGENLLLPCFVSSRNMVEEYEEWF